MGEPATRVVGRSDELGSFDHALDRLGAGYGGAIALVGEPGIGKTRLLHELAQRAESRGNLVLSGSASDLERNLPFSVFVDALDDYVESVAPKLLETLAQDVRGELGRVLPSLASFAGPADRTLHHERYRGHRAVRALLDRLAAPTPLVLQLDDMHWADAASFELLAALLRRPPSAAVLITVAFRPRRLPERFTAACERAHRDAGLMWLELRVLTPGESRQLLGDEVSPDDAAVLYEESGGNPFYLEQLARSRDLPRLAGDRSLRLTGVPPAVTTSLGEELAMLSDTARHVLDGAAIAGDPFALELAATAAAVSEEATMDALDECLRLDLVRSTAVPRRFRFRHPLLRRAIYEATPGGWRVGAHERCAEVLAQQGAPPQVRAHHVERSGRAGDPQAVAVLRAAGEASAGVAPAAAAEWFAGALRLLPDGAPVTDRVELLLAHAGALAATGRFADSHEVLVEGLATVPADSIALRTRLAIACARTEHRLGRYEQAHGRLLRALNSLPDVVSGETVALLIELALNEFYRADYDAMHRWGERAVPAAEAFADPPLRAAALAMPALADAMTGEIQRARARRAEAAAIVDELTDEPLARCLDAAVWLAAAELYLDLPVDADTHARRAMALARATGQGELFLVVHQILGRVWWVLGNLGEATELLDGAIEAARLSGNTQALVGALFNRSVVALAVGDAELGVDTARESAELAGNLDRGFVATWASVRFGRALLETSDPAGAAEILGPSTSEQNLRLIPAGWRPHCLELVTRCELALGRRAEAERAAARAAACAAAAQLPLASSWADRAAAALALDEGDAEGAAMLARRSAAAAERAVAPIEAALARTLAGRALALAGQPEEAIVELRRAAHDLDAIGARHYRDGAEHELGKLGQRTHRRTTPGVRGATGIDSLTGRELEVARLVVDRKTNTEIAEELFLSRKTVETHLRHIFDKMNVRSRASLARAIERAQQSRTSPRVQSLR